MQDRRGRPSLLARENSGGAHRAKTFSHYSRTTGSEPQKRFLCSLGAFPCAVVGTRSSHGAGDPAERHVTSVPSRPPQVNRRECAVPPSISGPSRPGSPGLRWPSGAAFPPPAPRYEACTWLTGRPTLCVRMSPEPIAPQTVASAGREASEQCVPTRSMGTRACEARE
jgi:hypothetical protein